MFHDFGFAHPAQRDTDCVLHGIKHLVEHSRVITNGNIKLENALLGISVLFMQNFIPGKPKSVSSLEFLLLLNPSELFIIFEDFPPTPASNSVYGPQRSQVTHSNAIDAAIHSDHVIPAFIHANFNRSQGRLSD